MQTIYFPKYSRISFIPSCSKIFFISSSASAVFPFALGLPLSINTFIYKSSSLFCKCISHHVSISVTGYDHHISVCVPCRIDHRKSSVLCYISFRTLNFRFNDLLLGMTFSPTWIDRFNNNLIFLRIRTPLSEILYSHFTTEFFICKRFLFISAVYKYKEGMNPVSDPCPFLAL